MDGRFRAGFGLGDGSPVVHGAVAVELPRLQSLRVQLGRPSHQRLEHSVSSTGPRAQGLEHRASSTGPRAQRLEHSAWNATSPRGPERLAFVGSLLERSRVRLLAPGELDGRSRGHLVRPPQVVRERAWRVRHALLFAARRDLEPRRYPLIALRVRSLLRCWDRATLQAPPSQRARRVSAELELQWFV
ncbi:MAG: hypothetical protein ABI895_36980 [Deltaproteobacteria bacterium]